MGQNDRCHDRHRQVQAHPGPPPRRTGRAIDTATTAATTSTRRRTPCCPPTPAPTTSSCDRVNDAMSATDSCRRTQMPVPVVPVRPQTQRQHQLQPARVAAHRHPPQAVATAWQTPRPPRLAAGAPSTAVAHQARPTKRTNRSYRGYPSLQTAQPNDTRTRDAQWQKSTAVSTTANIQQRGNQSPPLRRTRTQRDRALSTR